MSTQILMAKLTLVKLEQAAPQLLLSENMGANIERISRLEMHYKECLNYLPGIISKFSSANNYILEELWLELTKLNDELEKVKCGNVVYALQINEKLKDLPDLISSSLNALDMNLGPQQAISELHEIATLVEPRLSGMSYNEKRFWENIILFSRISSKSQLLSPIFARYLIKNPDNSKTEFSDSFQNAICIATLLGQCYKDALVVEIGAGDFGKNVLEFVSTLGIRAIVIDPCPLVSNSVEIHQTTMNNLPAVMGSRKANIICMHAMEPLEMSSNDEHAMAIKLSDALLSNGCFFQVFTGADFVFNPDIFKKYFNYLEFPCFGNVSKSLFSARDSDFGHSLEFKKILEFNSYYYMLSGYLNSGITVGVFYKK